MIYHPQLGRRTEIHNNNPEIDLKDAFERMMAIPENVSEILHKEIHKRTKAKTEMGLIKAITKIVSRNVRHEDHTPGGRKFFGLRTPLETILDSEGHCIEINLLLKKIIEQELPYIEIFHSVSIHPKHCEKSQNPHEIGLHYMPFVRNEKNNTIYFLDAVGGEVMPFNETMNFDTFEQYNTTQFYSFLLHDACEDFLCRSKDYDAAKTRAAISLAFDVDNYCTVFSKGLIEYYQEKYAKSEKTLRTLLEEQTPDLMDTWKEVGDHELRINNRAKAKELYREAAHKYTEDLQVFRSLLYRALELDLKQEFKVIKNTYLEIYNINKEKIKKLNEFS